MANLRLVKLISGMELMGDCDPSPEGVTLTAAFQVMVQPVSDTQYSLGLVPLSVAVEGAAKGLTLAPSWSQILGVYNPTAALSETYHRMTGSIITPTRPANVIAITESSLGG